MLLIPLYSTVIGSVKYKRYNFNQNAHLYCVNDDVDIIIVLTEVDQRVHHPHCIVVPPKIEAAVIELVHCSVVAVKLCQLPGQGRVIVKEVQIQTIRFTRLLSVKIVNVSSLLLVIEWTNEWTLCSMNFRFFINRSYLSL